MKKYEDEIPGRRINNIWHRQSYSSDKRYVVQTADRVIERCVLMSTDPGDLVFDPTCGSGTTAQMAEKWGRRWITCDTSTVAVAVARQRLTTASHPFWTINNQPDQPSGRHDPAAGFIYEQGAACVRGASCLRHCHRSTSSWWTAQIGHQRLSSASARRSRSSPRHPTPTYRFLR